MYLEWFFKEKAAGEKSLEEVVVDLLAERKLHVTTAESCTGGLIAGTLVNVAGASDVLNEGYVTYSNEAKERLIHVSHEILETYGAVSEQTAHEMAEGAAKAANADAALSATGIAGPGGGTEEKPVGLVYIGCYLNGKTTVKECRWNGSRMENRLDTVKAALEMLKEEGLFEKLDEKICIGQGYRGKTGVLGVGHCTCKFQNYVEGCPPLEGDIYEFLKEYIGERTPGK